MKQELASDGAEPPSFVALDAPPLDDRSMQIMEYLIASIAVLAALSLAFLR